MVPLLKVKFNFALINSFLKVFQSIHAYHPQERTIVTLGTFDGVHIGHKKILERLVQSAAENHCESLILTFFPHPRMILNGNSDVKLLNTIDEKRILLEQAGIDNLIIHPFDTTFSNLSAEEFVKDILVETFNIQKIIIGHDHRFGKGRSADINDLISFGLRYGFDVEQIDAQEINDVSVSSTRIRNALIDRDISLANKYLGYKYILTGVVIEGKKLGRTIGYPTANISIAEDYKLIPKQGVYVVRSIIDGAIVHGMMNIGTNPTVGGTTRSIEVHYFDFNHNLYGKSIQVSFLKRLRDEQRFDSLDKLKQQLADDQELSFEFINSSS
jgi:riboflavin kinase/FMN adenylyltransferase